MPHTVAQIFDSLGTTVPGSIRAEAAPMGSYVVALKSPATSASEVCEVLVVHESGRKQAWNGSTDAQHLMAIDTSTLVGRQVYRFADAAVIPEVGMKTLERVHLLADTAWAAKVAAEVGLALPDKRTPVKGKRGVYIVAHDKHRGLVTNLDGASSTCTIEETGGTSDLRDAVIDGKVEGWLVIADAPTQSACDKAYRETGTAKRLAALVGPDRDAATKYVEAIRKWGKREAGGYTIEISQVLDWLKDKTVDCLSLMPKVRTVTLTGGVRIIHWTWGYRQGVLRAAECVKTHNNMLALQAATESLGRSTTSVSELWVGDWSVVRGGRKVRDEIQYKMSDMPTPKSRGDMSTPTGTSLWTTATPTEFSTAWIVSAGSGREWADGRAWKQHDRAYVVGTVSNADMAVAWRATALSAVRDVGSRRLSVDIPACMPLVVPITALDK